MNILPSEYITNGMITYLNRYNSDSRKIYWLVLLAVVAALIALPFIYVDVSVQNQGMVRPVAEKAEIKAAMTELIDSIYVKEGQVLNQGDTILTFNRSVPNTKIEYQKKRIDDFREQLNDLKYLAKGLKPSFFSSPLRQQEYTLYIRKKEEHETNLEKAGRDLERSKKLFDKMIIAEEEYEGYLYEYNKTKKALTSLEESQITQWQNDLNSGNNAYEEVKAAMYQEIKGENRYVAIAPVSGVLDQFKGIYSGNVITAGTTLAVISPDSTLYVEVYVSPRNIGYIRIGMPVNIRVGSFNYNEWGSIAGEVTEISSDFMTDLTGNNAFYKVKCNMERKYLVRKNGTKGILKKGMSVSAHFMITKRSLFELLYQKIDDWANPTQYDNMQ